MKNLIPFTFVIFFIGFTSYIPKEKWTNLFNGKDLKNWKQRGGKAVYEVKNKMIIGTSTPETPNSFMCTEKEYLNFILELEVKVDTSLNSGIQIRSHSLPAYKNGVVHGYQVEIDPSARAWSGGLYDEQRRGWLFKLDGKPEAQKAFKKYDWNKYRIEALNNRITTFINGVPCTDFTDTLQAEKGFIALQVHSIKKPWQAGKQVMWRNIRIIEK
ncbi:MAG: DUF1080 domain-containing protein [Verrucomicrobia bacterium]|nr:DUF1080 domain-containing protein [Cytophagales bacterium]